ncbi:MAG TPA: hypothetical protein VFS43_42380 [Polyangiaceae bacterium]|nr:hypothetical protein [Polyangiaceae bacterium]
MKVTFAEFAKGWLAPGAAGGGEAEGAEPEDWGPARRVAFRFAFAYLVLYNSFGPLTLLGEVPPFSTLMEGYEALWNAIVPWVGRRVLGVTGPIVNAPTGAGDTMYAYVRLFCDAVLAVAATAVWSLLDRRRPNYARLQGALRVYLRYTLALAILFYGADKVIKAQFPTPTLGHLARTYGESTPMGLLWTFMGYSTAYNVFAGAGETLGGLLLFFRRTTTLGALVVSAVMGNVVMLNFCYDVPVKLYSTHLLLMAFVLLAPDARRLADVLVLGRATAALAPRAPFRARWLERARLVVKPLFIVGALWTVTSLALSGYQVRGPDAPKPELYGMYQVESFERKSGGAAAPWATLAVGRGSLVMRRADGAGRSLRVKLDPDKKRIELAPLPAGLRAPGEGPVELAYERPDPEHLRLEGEFEGEAIVVTLKKVPEPPSRLMSRGFHWVNELPYNR